MNNIPKEILPLIPDYLKNRKLELEQLKKLVEQGDLVEIKRIGHKLAGNAGSYGLFDLGEIGVKIEGIITIKDVIPLIKEYEDCLNVYNLSN